MDSFPEKYNLSLLVRPLRQFRNQKETGRGNFRKDLWDRNWYASVSFCQFFLLSPVTVPEVLAKFNPLTL